MFDWINFLRSYNIPFIDKGTHTSKGNISINCPFCDYDENYYLGISLNQNGWGCWWSSGHRGRNPRRLVQALLKCTYQESLRIVGQKEQSILLPNDLDFNNQIKELCGIITQDKLVINQNITLEVYPKFKKLRSVGLGKLFVKYLVSRGYSKNDIPNLGKLYNLQYATIGEFGYRIIIPIYMDGIGLTTWTGRSINNHTKLEYRDLEKEKSIIPLKHTLFNHEDLINNPKDTLVVCEGPFDSIRLDYIGFNYGIRSTCLFGKEISDEQVDLLSDLSIIYKNKILLLDKDADIQMILVMEKLGNLGFESRYLPHSVKDPAGLNKMQILQILQ